MSAYTYTDDKGRVWNLFDVKYYHPLDDSWLSFQLWAIDHADAVDRLQYLASAEVIGQIEGEV